MTVAAMESIYSYTQIRKKHFPQKRYAGGQYVHKKYLTSLIIMEMQSKQ